MNLHPLAIWYLAVMAVPLAIVVRWIVYIKSQRRKFEDAARIEQAHEANRTCIRLDEIRRGI